MAEQVREQSNLVAFGSRLPKELKDALSSYCRDRGIVQEVFVAQAIAAKLPKQKTP